MIKYPQCNFTVYFLLFFSCIKYFEGRKNLKLTFFLQKFLKLEMHNLIFKNFKYIKNIRVICFHTKLNKLNLKSPIRQNYSSLKIK